MTALSLPYFYGCEAEQFAFYRIPKLLMTDDRFRGISTDAKLLYGLMLDRMSLSLKNGWQDEQGRVYIYYPADEIIKRQSSLRNWTAKKVSVLLTECGKGKASRQ